MPGENNFISLLKTRKVKTEGKIRKHTKNKISGMCFYTCSILVQVLSWYPFPFFYQGISSTGERMCWKGLVRKQISARNLDLRKICSQFNSTIDSRIISCWRSHHKIQHDLSSRGLKLDFSIMKCIKYMSVASCPSQRPVIKCSTH